VNHLERSSVNVITWGKGGSTMADPWPLIHAEREALADDLATVTDEQWATPSLCAGWSVRDVLAHMAATAKMTPPAFFVAMAAAGFRFNTMTARGVARETAGTPAEGLAEFRRYTQATSHPPGPTGTWLSETVVHSADIRRPLGMTRDYPDQVLVQTADFVKVTNLLLGAKKRIDGLSLRATDADWATGSGPRVSGPLLSLIMAMTGRQAALDDLTGEGVSVLRERG
jgi:uncharacterized protein (TIGR03083 family)